jgi:hypothetical protein
MDWLKAYRNGSFEPEYWYVCLYGKIPNKYEYTVPDELEIDTAKISIDAIKSKFKTINSYRLYNQTVVRSASEAQKSEEIFDFRFTDSGYLIINADNKVIRVITNCVTIWYDKDKLEDIEKLAKEVFECFESKEEESGLDKINLIKVYQGDYYTSKNDIKHTVINIEENYNNDFKKVYDDTIDFLNDRSSGLILYHGKAGTGKTNLIRHLISTVPKEYIVVPNSVATRLGDPDLIGFITDHTDSVFILEDCEQLLEDREDNPFNNAIATILNMADGLLSDVCNIKFICTFNADVDKIDPALLRKGRCVAKYEFKELSEEKVKFLNDKYNLGHKEIKPMTLAEVYNAEKPDYIEKKDELKIGF